MQTITKMMAITCTQRQQAPLHKDNRHCYTKTTGTAAQSGQLPYCSNTAPTNGLSWEHTLHDCVPHGGR